MEDIKVAPHDDPATARKRRKAILTTQRSSESLEDDERDPKRSRASGSSSSEYNSDDSVLDDGSESVKPSIRGIKKQARYVPGVSMTKEQLKTWRKEARRVRNRESAAASRNKTRQRINELEIEVNIMKSKYSEALQRILELEQGNADSFTPDRLRQDLINHSRVISPSPSTASSPIISPAVSPPASPRDTLVLSSDIDDDSETQDRVCEMHHQLPMDMIFRPTAEKTSHGTGMLFADDELSGRPAILDEHLSHTDICEPTEAPAACDMADCGDEIDIDENDLGDFLRDTFGSTSTVEDLAEISIDLS